MCDEKTWKHTSLVNTRMKSKALLIARIHTRRTWKHMDSNKNEKQSLMHLLFATSPSNTKDGEVQATLIVHHPTISVL